LAVITLKHCWEGPDSDGLKKLCPTTGTVKVAVLDQKFTLEAKDFSELILDGTQGTHTTKWTVLEEHVEGDGPGQTISVEAKHQYVDASGKSRSLT
jgi:hypothetical protein